MKDNDLTFYTLVEAEKSLTKTDTLRKFLMGILYVLGLAVLLLGAFYLKWSGGNTVFAFAILSVTFLFLSKYERTELHEQYETLGDKHETEVN